MTISFGGKPVFPAPWLADDDGQRLVFIRTEFGNTVAVLRAEHGVSMDLARGTARHICKTVNMHDELVAFVTRVAGSFPQGSRAPLGDDARDLLVRVTA